MQSTQIRQGSASKVHRIWIPWERNHRTKGMKHEASWKKKLQISIVTDIWQNKMMGQHVLLEENELDHFEFREVI